MRGGRTFLRDFVPVHVAGKSRGRLWHHLDITALKRAQEALRESEEQLRAVSESSQVQLAVGRVSDGVILFTNPAYDEAFGYERGALVGRRTPDLYADIAERAPLLAALSESGSVRNRDVRLKRRDGTLFWVSLSLRLIRFAGEPAILSSSVDISERKIQEARIARLSRLYSVLSSVNEAIVRAPDERSLLDRICTIVVDDGGFPLVWVGRVEGREVRPVAVCGPEADYMKDVRVEVTGALGRGPTGTCIREDRPVVNDDFDTNAATAPWREPALRHGFRASVALPLHRGGEATGALTIYAHERGAFDAEEIRLLESLAADVSYAFDALEAERRRLQTVEALRESEATLHLAQQTASSGTWDWDVATGNIRWTPEMFAVFGLDPDKDAASFETWGRVLHPDDAAGASARIETALKEHTPLRSEYRIIRPDGKLRWIWATGEGKYDSSGSPVRMVGVCQDITGRRQAEEALRRNEATQRGILDATKESVWLFSTDGVVLLANAMALTRFGKAGPEVIGKSMEEILSPDLARLRRTRLQEVVKSGRPVEFEDERAGIQFRHSFYPVRDAGGRVTAVASFSRDITESRRAEAALAASEEQFRAVSESSAVQLVVTRLSDNTILFTNAAFDLAFGYARGELVGRSAPEMYVDPADRAALVRMVSETGLAENFEVRVKKRDGTQFWCSTSVRLLDFAGEPAILGAAVDITERKQTEQALREAKETLEAKVDERTAKLTAEIDERRRAEERLAAASQYSRSLLESSLDPLVTISADGKITDVNEATIKATGLPRGQLIGTDFADYFTEPEKAREGYRRVFADGFVTDYALTIRHRDGRLTDVLYNASVYKDTRGSVIGVFAAARDVTDRNRAEQALRKAHDTLELRVAERTADLERSNADLEQFAYAASHDLQQPLRMVASYVGLLSQRYRAQLDEKADRYIDYAVGGAKRMQALVDGLLHYSRVGTRGGAVTRLDAAAVVAEARANLSECIEESGAVIEVGALPEVAADRSQMVQLFQNLLDNAIKFRSRATPVVSVTCRDDGDRWEFAVRDNGIGIDPKHAERVFEVFKRLHTEQEYPGTGIGLALCRKIVERHGGTIRVESEPGKGSTFIFTLPASGAATASAQGPRS